MTIELVTTRTAPTAIEPVAIEPVAIEPVAAQRRRLMAVMLADVVGYSRMMSRSEDETHARFAGHARGLIDPTVAKYNGRLVRSMGDGLLVEFSSAVDAVRCALDIQRELAARQAILRDGRHDRGSTHERGVGVGVLVDRQNQR